MEQDGKVDIADEAKKRRQCFRMKMTRQQIEKCYSEQMFSILRYTLT